MNSRCIMSQVPCICCCCSCGSWMCCCGGWHVKVGGCGGCVEGGGCGEGAGCDGGWYKSWCYSIYQRSQSLDDYLDEFLNLVADSDYTDPKTIMLKFRRGLNPQIQNSVATMASGRPSDTNLSGWYDMAWTIDKNWVTNEAFDSSWVSHPIPSWPIGASVVQPSLSMVPQLHAHSTPTPGNPVLMDIDTARRKSQLFCFWCKKPGHSGNKWLSDRTFRFHDLLDITAWQDSVKIWDRQF